MPELKENNTALDRIAKVIEAVEVALVLVEESDILGRMRRGAHRLNAAIREVRRDDAQEES